MIDAIVTFAITRRWQVLLLTLLLVGIGVFNLNQLAIDAVPDITNIQVQINTAAPGYSPLEVEQRITYPIENAMAGIPKMALTRSLSRYGLSQVTVIFAEGTDIYWARQQISERLQQVRPLLPMQVDPLLGPITSGLGEIYTYAITAKKGALNERGQPYSLADLRIIQDWIVRPQLVTVSGVTEINSIGGFERQYQVAPIPAKLLAYKITFNDVIEALSKNNQNTGAGFIERAGEQFLIRSVGQLDNETDIENIVVAKRDDAPVRVKDIAEVTFGKALRTGAATLAGQEAVIGTAMMLMGENSKKVAQAVDQALLKINRSLPQGVIIKPLYNRMTLVDKTIQTVKTNLLEGAILVIVILFLLLGNIRAACITALVIPLSLLFAISGMATHRVSGNLMSLGAIDFGLIVDGAVIVVENALRRLSLAQRQLGRVQTLSERLIEVKQSTLEVFKPAVFGILIIMLVYLPIFALSGVEGKMFRPMAFTVVAALIGALIFSVTFVPAAIAIFVRGKVSIEDNLFMHFLKTRYQRALHSVLKQPIIWAVAVFILLGASLWQGTRLGAEFLPELDEHDMALHALRITGTGLNQSVEMQKNVEQVLLSLPEVKTVFSKIGTPEVATDPMPPNVADTIVILKPRAEWPDPTGDKSVLIKKMRLLLEQIPGNQYEFTQPIAMRFNELIAGVRADLAIRVYGDDLDQLAKIGHQMEQLVKQVTGAEDVRMEQVAGLPFISVSPKLDHLGLLHLSVDDVQKTLQLAVAGKEIGQIYQGDQRFPLVVRLNQQDDQHKTMFAKIPLFLAGQEAAELAYVPLGEVAEIAMQVGPNQVNRQNGKRNVVVTANVENRDLGSFVRAVQTKLNSELSLPAGYWLDYGGTFEQLQSAKARLSWVIPITLLLILVLLMSAFNSIKDALLIFTGVPLALTGGIFALSLRDFPLSISAAIGFIALSGIAVLNGVVMLSLIKTLRQQGLPLTNAIMEGATQRLRPILMTALVASLGFVPMAFNTGAGAEVQKPLATVVIGGILSATVLTLFILPLLYRWVYRANER